MCLVVYSYRKELIEQQKERENKENKRSKTDVEITEPEPLLLSSYVNVALEKGSPATSTRRSSDFLDPENHKNNDDNSPEVCSEATIYLNLTKK